MTAKKEISIKIEEILKKLQDYNTFNIKIIDNNIIRKIHNVSWTIGNNGISIILEKQVKYKKTTNDRIAESIEKIVDILQKKI